MKYALEYSQKVSLTYAKICKPLCHELHLPQTAFDILMFLANNPEYQTASEIVEIRKIKASLVSVNVDKLVKEGYLTREIVSDDRRKTKLICTQKAAPIIEKGRQLQERFFETLFGNIPPEQKEIFFQTLNRINANLDYALENMD